MCQWKVYLDTSHGYAHEQGVIHTNVGTSGGIPATLAIVAFLVSEDRITVMSSGLLKVPWIYVRLYTTMLVSK